jgi:hypothetical protein
MSIDHVHARRGLVKYSGRVHPHNVLHHVTLDGADHLIAPTTVKLPDGSGIPQYAPAIDGGVPQSFNPGTDCNGNFTSCRFQPNNNCYAYACNMATNTFAQPGRCSGHPLTELSGPAVIAAAESDGLINVGSRDALKSYPIPASGGHFVALMVSPAYPGHASDYWGGDYHWARCDNSMSTRDSWSQKDGGDQV